MVSKRFSRLIRQATYEHPCTNCNILYQLGCLVFACEEYNNYENQQELMQLTYISNSRKLKVGEEP